MSFTWPLALLGLLLVPLLGAAYVLAQRTRRRDTLRYPNVLLVRAAVGPRGAVRRHLPAAFYLLAIAAISIGLSRPHMPLPNAEKTGTVILALDVSGSMRTNDVKPTRIDAAVAAIEDFVNKQPAGVRIGLVAFADSAQVMVAPTNDRKTLLKAVKTIRLQRGTNIGDGLQVAVQAILQDFGDSPGPLVPAAASLAPDAPLKPLQPLANANAATIILLSDGASTTGPPPLQVADQIAPTGIKVFTVGLGTIVGSGPARGFMELDEPALRGIAEKTGGKYFTAQNVAELRQVYDEVATRADLSLETTEVTAVFVGVALLMAVVAGAMGVLWFNRLP